MLPAGLRNNQTSPYFNFTGGIELVFQQARVVHGTVDHQAQSTQAPSYIMNSRHNASRACTLALALLVGTGTVLAQTTITGTAGGGDSWNDPTNWDAGVPTGAIDAIIANGVFAQVSNASTPLYFGSLTLSANSILKMHCISGGPGCGLGSENAVDGVSVIFMNAGSEIQVNMNVDVSFPPITLLGDAKLSSLFGASDWQTDSYDAITGAFTLTMVHFNGHTVELYAASDFSELILDTLDRWNLHAKAAGSLGTGNVTINPRADGRSASLYIDTADALADSATLTLNGSAGQGGFSGDGSDYLVMNADDTIAALYVYGVQLPAGSYTDSEPWLSGTGTLTVTLQGIGNNYCSPANLNSTGQSALIAAFGSTIASANLVTLSASQLPMNVFGHFLNSDVQGFTPFPPGSQGNLCLAGGIGRHVKQIANSGSLGELAIDLNLTALPRPGGTHSVVAGEIWNFQCWFRDNAGGPTSNFTDGIEIVFQ